MGVPDFATTARAQLDGVAEILGGEWALLERGADAPLVVATSAGLTAALSGPDQDAVVANARRDGAVVQLGLGRWCHPAGRGERDGLADARRGAPERMLVGMYLPAGPPRASEVAFLEVILRSLGALAAARAEADSNRLRARQLELHATTDPLTGLLNRRGWDRTLKIEEDRCARHRLSAEVVVVDLDGLKEINDSLGHEAGDAVIMRAATFLFSAVRSHDAAARLGGDEFAVLATGAPPGANPVAARIEQALAEGQIAASIGAANRADTGDLDSAWREADVRMYRVKQRRRRAVPRLPQTVDVRFRTAGCGVPASAEAGPLP